MCLDCMFNNSSSITVHVTGNVYVDVNGRCGLICCFSESICQTY